MDHINWLAALVAGIVGYFPGAVWYSPAMFQKAWTRELGLYQCEPGEQHGMAKTLIGVIPSIAAAITFALLLGPQPSLARALIAAVACAGGLIATSFAIQYLHEGRSTRFWLINSGYHLVQFLVFGLVLGLWH